MTQRPDAPTLDYQLHPYENRFYGALGLRVRECRLGGYGHFSWGWRGGAGVVRRSREEATITLRPDDASTQDYHLRPHENGLYGALGLRVRD